MKSLSTKIEQHHSKALEAKEIALDHALEAGKLLLQAKTEGEPWLSFLKSASINPRIADRYMLLVDNEHYLRGGSVSGMGVVDRLRVMDAKVII